MTTRNIIALLDSLRLTPDDPITTAINKLTQGTHKIVLITDPEYRLLGIITDYDIRKAVLDHVAFDRPVSEIMNRYPITLPIGSPDAAIQARMEQTNRVQLPLLDDKGHIVDIRFRDEFAHFNKGRPENTVVIMAGGLGSRMRPMTDRVPKPLLTVGGRPILFILLDQILAEGFDRIFISLNYKSEMIIRAIHDVPQYRDRVEFLMENDTMLGTAGSLSLLPQPPAAPFVVINGDLLTNVALREMLIFHSNDRNDLTMAVRHEHHKIPYGVVDLDGTQVKRLREKPVFSYYFNTGIYVVEPALLKAIPPDQQWNMTDLVDHILEKSGRVGAFPVHEFWIDIGTPDQYERAQTEFETMFS